MPVQAAIVYSGIINQAVSSSSPFDLDIDNDSTAEYRFSAAGVTSGSYSVSVEGLEDDTNWIRFNPGGDPSNLAQDARIDASGNYTTTATTRTITSDFNSGQWEAPYPTDGFMGVRFELAGSTHYGWIEITTNSASTAVLNSWAYESVADTAINAGDTGIIPLPSTSALMLGALVAAMAVRRGRSRWSARRR